MTNKEKKEFLDSIDVEKDIEYLKDKLTPDQMFGYVEAVGKTLSEKIRKYQDEDDNEVSLSDVIDCCYKMVAALKIMGFYEDKESADVVKLKIHQFRGHMEALDEAAEKFAKFLIEAITGKTPNDEK